ncbi:Putative LOC100748423, partial [Caligus rogercresseyi]
MIRYELYTSLPQRQAQIIFVNDKNCGHSRLNEERDFPDHRHARLDSWSLKIQASIWIHPSRDGIDGKIASMKDFVANDSAFPAVWVRGADVEGRNEAWRASTLKVGGIVVDVTDANDELSGVPISRAGCIACLHTQIVKLRGL